MKYLTLSREELKELIKLKKSIFLGYLIAFSIILIVSYFISDSILTDKNGISPMAIVFLLTISYLVIFFYSNRSYFLDLLKKEKRVYKGVLSSKTIKSKEHTRYHFNMDGNIFIVDKETFDRFSEGDIVEFHMSSFTRHLFKVEKVNEAY
ncbi:MAG TPA: SoxR reducing system RseC family protein [Cytophagaceae bacterium]|jgi:hypothetical protein|nr:SoxR reducing system RseC family protein [Cytophagaceae bacterium]